MTGGAFGEWRPSSWAEMARRVCSECGLETIKWVRSRDLAWKVAPGMRLRVFELVGFVGDRADAWWCESCGAFGAFDPNVSF